MKETYLPTKAKALLDEFESAFSNTWDAAQDILFYIEDAYDGDRSEFMENALRNSDYHTVAQALQAIFAFSEN